MGIRKKKNRDQKLSPSTDPELTIAQTLDISFRKSTCQIPFYVLTEKKIDPQLFLKAFNEEIRRNDSLRMRWVSFGNRLKPDRRHYFIPEYSVREIPEADFSKRTFTEMEQYLFEDTGKPLHYLKGDVFRVRLLHAPDGRDGIYMIVSHLNMDLYAMLICIQDLLGVYDALEKGGPLPAPLYPYEEMYRRDMEKEQNSALRERQLRYYREYYESIPKSSFYAGFDRMRQLKRVRRLTGDPARRYISHSPLNNPSACRMKFEIIDKERVDALTGFCRENGISLQSLFMTGIRAHLSRWNERTDDIMLALLCNRRGTLKEQHTGGCRVNVIPFRAVIDNGKSFLDAVRELNVLMAGTVKRSDLGFFPLVRYIQKKEHQDAYAINTSCYFSCIPPESVPEVPGWNLEYRPAGLRHFPFFPYFLIQPLGNRGKMSIAVIYQYRKFSDEDIEIAYADIWKVIGLGMEDPSLTLDRIIDQL